MVCRRVAVTVLLMASYLRSAPQVGFFTEQLEHPYNMAAGLPHSERRERQRMQG